MTLLRGGIGRLGASSAGLRRGVGRQLCRFPRPALATVLGRDISIGILREDYDKWERRVPITPDHVKHLIDNYKGDDKLTGIYVQPSQRIFPDSQYEKAGAIVTEDLSQVDVLLGVKRVADEENLIPNKTYMFFSHVIKGQPENMELLKTIIEKNIQLFDYEAIAEDVKDPTTGKLKKRRLVAFGKYAGIAGMIDTLQCLGRRLLASGYSTPFLNVSPAYVYYDLDDARRGIRDIGNRIEKDGLPGTLEPLVFAFTGSGNVTNGALEIFKLLPHKMITLEEARDLKSKKGPQNCLYGVMVQQEDIVKKTVGQEGSFDVKHYRANPSEYESTFASNVAPVCNVIVNGIYWDERYPRLLTKQEMSDLYKQGNKSLFAVGDISCDVNGSIEFLQQTTTIDKPFFSWNPTTNKAVDDINEDGVAVMGVDILPTELSVESSKHFGDALLPLLKQLILDGYSGDGKDFEKLPPELVNACIARDGSLTPNFEYIEALMKRPAMIHHDLRDPHVLLRIKGHLFDSGLINQILDVIERLDCHFEIEECSVTPTVNGIPHKSVLMLRVFSEDDSKLDSVITKVDMLLHLIDSAEASMQHFENRPQSSQSKDSSGKSKVRVLGEKEKQVLILGAGKVAGSCAEYLGRSKSTTVAVASMFEDEAMAVAKNASRGKAVTCDLSQPGDKLRHLIEDADVVVSLLPAPLHPMVAQECISLKTDLVTASYESDEMRALCSSSEDAGVSILNEVGLDPGMDHMSAMKIIDNVHERGGEVTSFSSVCGGLPAPEAANNPLLYKFSWSPLGVLRASQNDATYRRDGQVLQVSGTNLLASAEPFYAWKSLNLECLPNRDSLIYGEKYGIQSSNTIFRGTLRYQGFSSLLHVFQNMGILNDKETGATTWHDTLEKLQRDRGFHDLRTFLLSCSDGDKDLATRVNACMLWLGLKIAPVSDPSSMVKSFCDLLEQHLQFEESERDMVLMHHDIKAIFDDGSSENHSCSMQLFGDNTTTAMSKTVGYTAAIGTKLILDGFERKGLLLPTSKDIYTPSLDLLKEEGIIFEEHVHVEQDYDEVV
mmetsp:Transcript_32325/g.68355  ORF Transcript_32325/g.68355 Transcript_32325/m.68355 type:complete len:1058 (+) Transcript_32325:153-3326(+)|eukprot:CAMPEP_0183703316 /NCGR_PEP_ID=MMETSP0737-20130205/1099_1 /TAXON_ID=385413 /ORGANISM="Thalassiosira miniscula, Strain CCMP1093" /LENGTH=1057 /DNA_ID=CAMNT_0025930045 /DNA_START=95 /DNA_END=3268 /DNA_ORIENTATION=-